MFSSENSTLFPKVIQDNINEIEETNIYELIITTPSMLPDIFTQALVKSQRHLDEFIYRKKHSIVL